MNKMIKTFEAFKKLTHLSQTVYDDLSDEQIEVFRRFNRCVMNGQESIDTSFGTKRDLGLLQMIKNNTASDVADALLNYDDTIETTIGTKSKEWLKNSILRIYDYEKETTKKDFNL